MRDHFLLPRLLLNELQLARDLVGSRPPAGRFEAPPGRDSVCGMALAGTQPRPTATYAEREYRFCSKALPTPFLGTTRALRPGSSGRER